MQICVDMADTPTIRRELEEESFYGWAFLKLM